MKVIIALLAVLAVSQCAFLRNHQMWYTAPKELVNTFDWTWNYCDMKCTYLETVAATQGIGGLDFVSIEFTQGTLYPNFAACYLKTTSGATVVYRPWYTVVSNEWFETNCGDGDRDEDYYALTTPQEG